MLFSRVLEVYSVNDDEPVHSVTFDTNQTSFTYNSTGPNQQVVVSDDKGRLSVFTTKITTEADNSSAATQLVMRLVRTPYTRLKSLQASPDGSFFCAVTNRSVALWGTEQLERAFEERPDDLMCRVDPTTEIA